MHVATTMFVVSLALTGGCASRATHTDMNSSRPTAHAVQDVQRVADDSAITARVLEKFKGDPQVQACLIEVATEHGSVQLSGYVENRDDIRRAVRIALGVEGVRTVRNELEQR